MHVCSMLQLRFCFCATSYFCVRFRICVCDFVFVCATSYFLLATSYLVVRLRICVVRLHNCVCDFLLCSATSYLLWDFAIAFNKIRTKSHRQFKIRINNWSLAHKIKSQIRNPQRTQTEKRNRTQTHVIEQKITKSHSTKRMHIENYEVAHRSTKSQDRNTKSQ